MESADTLNVRIDASIAEQLATRAHLLGISRQQLIDLVLQREVLVGVAWGQPLALAPGLLPLSKELDVAPKSKQWVFVYRLRDTDAFVLMCGAIDKALPTMLYVRPPGGRAYPILRAQLFAWQELSAEPGSDFFDVVVPWFSQGATLHPSAPRRWHEELMRYQLEVANAMRGS